MARRLTRTLPIGVNTRFGSDIVTVLAIRGKYDWVVCSWLWVGCGWKILL